MAYKFQLGSARLSGSTVFEQPLSTLESFSAQTLSSSAGLQVGGTVELDGVAEAVADEAADKFYILDARSTLILFVSRTTVLPAQNLPPLLPQAVLPKTVLATFRLVLVPLSTFRQIRLT